MIAIRTSQMVPSWLAAFIGQRVELGGSIGGIRFVKSHVHLVTAFLPNGVEITSYQRHSRGWARHVRKRKATA